MPHKLTWKKLLSSDRVPRPESQNVDIPYIKEDRRTAFEQDYDRIVFSPLFRRLARKSQVHPMASDDHTHNRLTHSIEVASVGRSFALRVADIAMKRSDLSEEDVPKLAWVLQSACLIHSLGNPPFGHAGKEVIKEWAAEHQNLLFPKEQLKADPLLDASLPDWLNFEGDAQGFRFAARADNRVAGYLRLTYATLSATVKNPWSSADERTDLQHKHNVYSTEIEVFQQMAVALGTITDDNQWCRHPLSFLTEAADDICNRIIDLEDAVEMGICEHNKVHELYLRICRDTYYYRMPLSQLRRQAIRSLMDRCWWEFEKDFDAIMNGLRTNDLNSSLAMDCQDELEKMGAIYDSVFGHRMKVATEISAYHVLGRILKALVKTIQSISSSDYYDDIHSLSKRTIELTWGRKHVEANLEMPYRWWLSQVMDYVSGMTDEYAIRLAREIGGFSADVE